LNLELEGAHPSWPLPLPIRTSSPCWVMSRGVVQFGSRVRLCWFDHAVMSSVCATSCWSVVGGVARLAAGVAGDHPARARLCRDRGGPAHPVAVRSRPCRVAVARPRVHSGAGHRHTPWLGKAGLTVSAVLFLLGGAVPIALADPAPLPAVGRSDHLDAGHGRRPDRRRVTVRSIPPPPPPGHIGRPDQSPSRPGWRSGSPVCSPWWGSGWSPSCPRGSRSASTSRSTPR
jgi:hypothetical protein